MNFSCYFRLAVAGFTLCMGALSTNSFAITNAQVFSYAEANCASLFSGTPTAGSITYQNTLYDYRYYPTTGNYLAVDAAGVISILGPYTGNVIASVGPVTAYASAITAWEATQLPVSTTFTSADLVGTWNKHSLRSGVNAEWMRGVETWDSLGNYVKLSEVNSSGSGNLTGGVQIISADGAITDPAFADVHETMSASKDLVVLTATKGNGDPMMVIFQKQNTAATLTTADMAGTWDFHQLRTGVTNKWQRGVERWDASGAIVSVSEVSSNGAAYAPWTGNQTMLSATGSISGTRSMFDGVMSASKDLVVATVSAGNGDPMLVIFQKQNSAATFTSSDLAGKWNRHSIQSGVISNWNHGIETWDAAGNAVPGAELTSDGSTAVATPYVLAIATDGTITVPSDTSLHGTMSASKDFAVITQTVGGSQRLIIYQKAQ